MVFIYGSSQKKEMLDLTSGLEILLLLEGYEEPASLYLVFSRKV
jgi:hypothetical protein